jgi:CheY-like chemotaxis protein
LRIINDILDLSRIEAGQMTVEQSRCSPAQTVEEVVSLMRARAGEKGLLLEAVYEGDIPETICSDATRLRQILINLVGNAVKFTSAGLVQIRVCCERGAPVTQMAFEVTDTGGGLTPAEAAGLFHPFTQGDGTTTRAFGGTGLGLAISKRLALLLGGDVTLVRSEPGGGSCFRATVATGELANVRMLSAAEIRTARPAATETPVWVPPGDCLRDCRVLLAEDGADNQRLVAAIVRRAGGTITVAENGQLALEAVAEAAAQGQAYDAILMDMQMPVMDGYVATERLRQEGYEGPIIALTAHAMAGDREKCIEVGCNEHVPKPFDRARLLGVLAAYTAGRAPTERTAV